MLVEMHCHTAEHSTCSHVAATALVQRCFDVGLQGVILTDHHYLWPAGELAALRRQLRVPDYFVLLAGQEISTADFGDVLVYGAPVTIPAQTPLREIREAYPQAALIWAHPYRKQAAPRPERLLQPELDGVEIFNSNHTIAESHRGLQDWHRYKFTAIGGTDTHALGYAGTYPTIFDHPFLTIEEAAREIKRGRCRPYFKEIPRSGTSDTKVVEVILSPRETGERRKIVIKTLENPAAWESAARTARIMQEVARHGFAEGRFRLPRPLGDDPGSLSLIEQGIQGRDLFDMLVQAEPEAAATYLRLAAQWLARLHNCRLQITPPEEWLQNEPKRLEHYLSALQRMKHPHTRKAQEIMEAVLHTEWQLYEKHPERLVQGHGDYHPKNIFIGPEDARPDTCFVAAIDFNSSFTMPPAFDVGTFLAQFRNQFFQTKEVYRKVSPQLFLESYLQEADQVEEDFLAQVELFKARTSLSIVYYLIKVGLGESENLWRVLVEAEKSLAQLAFAAARTEKEVAD